MTPENAFTALFGLVICLIFGLGLRDFLKRHRNRRALEKFINQNGWHIDWGSSVDCGATNPYTGYSIRWVSDLIRGTHLGFKFSAYKFRPNRTTTFAAFFSMPTKAKGKIFIYPASNALGRALTGFIAERSDLHQVESPAINPDFAARFVVYADSVDSTKEVLGRAKLHEFTWNTNWAALITPDGFFVLPHSQTNSFVNLYSTETLQEVIACADTLCSLGI